MKKSSLVLLSLVLAGAASAEDLLAHDDRVAAENARVYHGIAANVQGEIRTGFSVQINVQHRLLFLDRQYWLSGGHTAEQGNSRRSGLAGYFDGSRFSGALLQIA